MPELPEVEGLAAWMRAELTGRRIESIRLRSVAALKTYDPPLSALNGRAVTGASRRGKYLALEAGELKLVAHLSLGGWVRWVAGPTKRKPSLRGPIVAEVLFEDGMLDFTEHGKEKRLALWLVRSLDDVTQIGRLGPEALSQELDEPAFAEILRRQRGTLKSVLADQHVIAGIGNAYSDEILHAAKLSPFLLVSKLDEGGMANLYGAMRVVLGDAVARAAEIKAADLKDDKRQHFHVHGRTGQSCPVCGDTIRAVWLGERSFQYCSTCQTGGRVYKDRRLSRILK
jgi:formamidopyrimidine-DNA glycosylase